jgi:hypothetical protein
VLKRAGLGIVGVANQWIFRFKVRAPGVLEVFSPGRSRKLSRRGHGGKAPIQRPGRWTPEASTATITIDVDLPPDLTITSYQRHGDGHGFEVSWPLPPHCRCERCGREGPADLAFKDPPRVVRDLDLWGQPSFWIYQPAYHRCPFYQPSRCTTWNRRTRARCRYRGLRPS